MSNEHGFTVLRPEQKKVLLDKLKRRKSNGYFRSGSFSDEIIWQDRKFLFPSSKKNVPSNLWVFRSVLSDVKFFIEGKRIREKERLPVNLWNHNLKNFRGKITATDVDHAYWRIAFLQGMISKKTYTKGLEVKDKSIRLAALANLSSSKEYQIIKDGIVTNETIILKHDPILQKVYNNIRYTCYEHMTILANMLGDDFICYKTDCIYYKDNEKNRDMVQVYLDSCDLEWKQLFEPPKPKVDEDIV
jgi:hypothetical protein